MELLFAVFEISARSDAQKLFITTGAADILVEHLRIAVAQSGDVEFVEVLSHGYDRTYAPFDRKIGTLIVGQSGFVGAGIHCRQPALQRFVDIWKRAPGIRTFGR